MAKNSVSDWDTTASGNTDISGIDIGENDNIDDAVALAMRSNPEMQSDLAVFGAAYCIVYANGAITRIDPMDVKTADE